MGTTLRRKNKVLAEFLTIDALFQVAIGSGDDADIHLDGAVAADAFKFTFLQNAQKLGLQGGRNFADLVQEDGATMGEFKAAFAFVHRAGKSTLFMAEEFALDQVSRDGGAVDLDEGARLRELC